MIFYYKKEAVMRQLNNISPNNISTKDYRLKVISPLISMDDETKEEKKEKRKMMKIISADTSISYKTIARWCEAYAKFGIEGLLPKYPKTRSDSRLYIKFEALLEEAKAMRLQTPTISVEEIIRCIESRHPNIEGILKRSTMQKHLFDSGFGREDLLREREQDGRSFYSRYRLPHKMLQVQGDVKEPPRGVCVDSEGLPVTPYVQLWMDNYSRKILTWKIDTSQTADIAISSLNELIKLYGIPDSILTDQGSIYRGVYMEHCTHTLGIEHKRSRPYKPQAKGALERLNGTIDDLFIPIKNMQNVDYQQFVKLVEERIIQYNATKHSALVEFDKDGKKHLLSPEEAFAKDVRTVRPANPDILEYAFNITNVRKVSKDGLISFHGKCYRIDDQYAKTGSIVTIIYSLLQHTVNLVVRNKPEDIDKGMPETSLYPLQEFVMKPHVDYSCVMKDRTSDEKKKLMQNLPQIPATVERLFRDISRKEGTYINEDDFRERIMPELIKKYDYTSLPNSMVTESAYAKSFPKSDNSSDINTATGVDSNYGTSTGSSAYIDTDSSAYINTGYNSGFCTDSNAELHAPLAVPADSSSVNGQNV